MVPPMRTDTLERTSSSTRGRILAAAAQLFSRSGYHATTVKDIARECSLTDPALYYHFQSKREILSALLVEPPILHVELRSAADRSIAALVEDFCSLFDFWSDHVSLLRLVYRQAVDADPDTTAFMGRVSAEAEQLLLPPLRELYGAEAAHIYPNVCALLTGIQLDALLEAGDGYTDLVATPAFRQRLRRLVLAALPPPAWSEAS